MNTLPPDWPNRASSRFVRSGGLDWHVQEMGAVEGLEPPVVLLIHGTGAATHSWRDVMPMLAKTARVVTIDLPGHGFTQGRPRGGMSLPSIADAVVGLLTEVERLPDLIVGHSAGAAIAMQMVLGGRVRPRALVGIAPALLPFPGIAQHLFPTMAKLLFVNPFAPAIFAQIARQPGVVGRFLSKSTGSTIDAAGVAAYARLFQRSDHCAGALAMMANWDLEPLKRALPTLALPVLVLHGARDAAIPVAAAREAAGLIPGAVVEVSDDAGHLLHEEMPERVVERVMAFLEACPERHVGSE